MTPDEDFRRQRHETFGLICQRLGAARSPGALDDIRVNAENDIRALFRQALLHLQGGAPGGQPGSMAEALTQASLRSSSLAAALGVRPPQFEPLYFQADYATGREAALFLSEKLVTAAEGDFPKSRAAIQQKILGERPADGLKEHMAIAFSALTEAYPRICAELRLIIRD